MTKDNKDQSPLVQAVLALDSSFSDLDRISQKIEGMELKSDFDFEQTQKLLNRFAECGNAVSEQVINMSQALNGARAKAEAAAQIVAARAELLQERQNERQKKMDDFRQLGERVKDLTASLTEFKHLKGEVQTDEDRMKIANRLAEFEIQLQPLIERAHELKKEAQDSKMKILEQGAESMRQSLITISQRLASFQEAQFPMQ